jgi:hypothetical protein
LIFSEAACKICFNEGLCGYLPFGLGHARNEPRATYYGNPRPDKVVLQE